MMEMVLMTGFLLAFGVSAFYTNTIVKLKDFQIASNNVTASMRQMNAMTISLLTTKAPVILVSANWNLSISEFQRELTKVSDYSDLGILTKEQHRQLYELTGWWDQIYKWYYLPAIEQMTKMQRSGAAAAVGDKGLLLTLLELESQPGDPPEFINDFYTMRNYQELIIEETQVFSDRLNSLTESIVASIDQNIQRSTRIVLIVLLVTLLTTILITSRFSHLMSGRIRKVEQAIRNLAQGDFSTELDIRSGDELEELSHNYNSLKNQLREKLNSVLDFMVSISGSLSEEPNLDSILSLIADAAVQNTEADGAAVYMVDSEGKNLIPKAFFGQYAPPFPVPESEASDIARAQSFAQKTEIPIGENLIGQAVQSVRPLFIRSFENLSDGTPGYHRDKDDPLYIHSLIITPLKISQRVLGAIVIQKQRYQDPFTDLDYTHMQTFADYAALTIDNIFNYEELIEKKELHREIEIAADIQKDLLPRELPDFPGVQIDAFSRAARGISGDYYDAFMIDKNKIEIVTCDVVGKGVPASLLMVMIRTILRLVSSPERSPGQLLTLLNRGIIGRVGTDHFATVSIFTYDKSTREVIFSNAAHPPLLVYRPSENNFIEIDTPGLPIGIEQKEKYREKTFQTQVGDVLVSFTDGIPETRSPDGREYGNENLKHLMRQVGSKSVGDITTAVKRDLERFTSGAEQHDDQTFVVLKVLK
jgi:serine phosphatase RsbU (regulator of sigma subunit)/HAMP domain-containing protein